MFNNFFDIAIIFVLIITTLWGFTLGFIASLLFLGIIFFGGLFFNFIVAQVSLFFASSNFDSLVQILFTLGMIVLIAKICQMLFSMFLTNAIFSKVAGGLLGFLTGIVISIFAVKYLKQFYFFQDEIARSTVIPYIVQISQFFSL